jgi:hypothetical protein
MLRDKKAGDFSGACQWQGLGQGTRAFDYVTCPGQGPGQLRMFSCLATATVCNSAPDNREDVIGEGATKIEN